MDLTEAQQVAVEMMAESIKNLRTQVRQRQGARDEFERQLAESQERLQRIQKAAAVLAEALVGPGHEIDPDEGVIRPRGGR